MPATTNFQIFNEANDAATTYNDSEYTNATQRQTGVVPGMAISRMHNKMYRQWSVMCKAIADMMVAKGYSVMDDDEQQIAEDLEAIINAAASDLGYLLRKNNTAYALGDIAFSASLPSYLVLKCTTAGTTAAAEPDFSGATIGGTVTDGTAVWTYMPLGTLSREIVPAFNKSDVVTVSGTYTAPVTGWYRITVKGGGGGGAGGGKPLSTNVSGGGGGEGGTSIGYEKMIAGDTATVVIGAGGSGGAKNTSDSGAAGTAGGNSTVTVNSTTYTGGGGGGGSSSGGAGGTGTIPGAPGQSRVAGSGASLYVANSSGGGNGGGIAAVGTMGGGGSGGASSSAGQEDGYAGGDGYVEFSYFDPSLM